MLFVFMNIAVACMVLSIIALRKVFLHKIPSVILGISWGLVFFRLFVPFDITTNYNFYNAFYYFIENVLHMSLSNSIFSNLVTIIVDTSQNKRILFRLFIVWICGVLYVGKTFAADFQKTIRLKQTFIPMENEKEVYEILASYGLSKKYLLYENETIASPIAYGILKPMILFPKGFYETHADMFDEALLHEYMHLKYHHQIIQYFLIFVVIINWFNPFIWIMYHYINRDMEVACDRGVLKLLGKEHRETYALQLVHLVEKNHGQRQNQLVFYNGFSKFVMKERIMAIMRYQKIPILAIILSISIPFGIISIFGASSNHIFGAELELRNCEVTVIPNPNADTITYAPPSSATLTWKQLAPYTLKAGARTENSIHISKYETVCSCTENISVSIDVTTVVNGDTYKGTFQMVGDKKQDPGWVAYYDGTLYRQ